MASIPRVLTCKDFWHIFFLCISYNFFGTFMTCSFKNYGSLYIHDDAFLSLAGSVGCLVNGIGRVFWGVSLDYIPFRKLFCLLFSVQLSLILLVEYSTNYKYFYFFIVITAMAFEGSMASIIPALTM